MSICTSIHPSGIGQSLGDSLVTRSPLYTSGDVWYVHHDGSNSNSGRSAGAPFATLAQAVSTAADDDIIVLLDGHAETITSTVTLSERLTIVGAGQSGGKPTVKLTNNQAAHLFDVTGNHVELRNLWLEEESQANSTGRVAISGTDCRIVGCYVECDENDNAGTGVITLESGWANFRMDSTTLISTATDATDPPIPGLATGSPADHLELDGVVVDGGTVGWNAGNGIRLAAAVTRVKGVDISLLRSSDVYVDTSCTGYLSVGTSSGDSRVYCASGA